MADRVYEEMAPLDQTLKALSQCTFLPGHPHKRFILDILGIPVTKLTERQVMNVLRLAYRYRRQMPGHLVPRMIEIGAAKPEPKVSRGRKRRG